MPRRSPKAGRPRKAGDRYPGGKLKPQKIAPNPRVIAERARLLGQLGNLEAADHPMDLALARGWLSEAQHRAGSAFARTYRQARLGAPALKLGGLRETLPPAQAIEAKALADWTDAETATVFDAVFNRTAPPQAREAAATAQLRALHAALSPAEAAEVTRVAVHASWPQWIIQRCAGRFDSPWEAGRELLLRGLDRIAEALSPRRGARGAAAPPRTRTAGPVREEVIRYETPEGELLYEAVVRRRGGG